MDKEAYLTFLALTMTPELRPFLSELVIPCDCHSHSGAWQCEGWRLKTMIRAELPVQAHARPISKRN